MKAENAYAPGRDDNMQTIQELREKFFEARRNHAPRKSLLEKMKWLKVLELMEVRMPETMDQWGRDLAAMDAIESNASWIAEHAKRMEAAARLLPAVPKDAIGPVRALRETAQQVSVTLALLKTLIERYETKPVDLRPMMEAAE